MEAIPTDCVHDSLRHLVYRNAFFMCQRLCAEFPSEVNLQLLASCYIQNNQAYPVYRVLKGTQMAQPRYLFQMDLLSEAEVAICPPNEPSVEVPIVLFDQGRYLMVLQAVLNLNFGKSDCVFCWHAAIFTLLALDIQIRRKVWLITLSTTSYADKAFGLASQASPHSLDGMDVCSTVLFHLNEDMKLSYLPQELIPTDHPAPQSWIAMGNCYGLQKDHETVLKNIQRAVQLNSKFAHAGTLCGHEYE